MVMVSPKPMYDLAKKFLWLIQPVVLSFVDDLGVHATVVVQSVAMVCARIEPFVETDSAGLPAVRYDLCTGIVSPYGRSSDELIVHEPVHADGRTYDAQRHISTDVCRLSRCRVCNLNNIIE